MNFSSTLIEEAVSAFSSLPGIGKKSALRMVLHLLKEDEQQVVAFTERIKQMRMKIKHCLICFNVSDQEKCSICLQPSRNGQTICVVESLRELMAIENTQQYNGSYHVLGGLISPLDGIGPDNLKIDALLKRIEQNEAKEIIFALSPTLEGDTTTYYISKKLPKNFKTTQLSRGVAFGGELEYADEMTLAKSIQNRTSLEHL